MRGNSATSPGEIAALFSPESLMASGRSSEKLSFPSLQSKMKSDRGILSELQLITRRFESSLDLFRCHSTVNPSSDAAVAKELGDLAMFLAHVSPFYAGELTDFPNQIAELLREDGRTLLSSLRCHLAHALILFINRKVVGIEGTLELFMELQIFGDGTLRKLAFSHAVHTIHRMNQKHKNVAQNRKLQNIIFLMLQGEDKARAKRALVVLSDPHRRRVLFDDRTANAICTACFHTSSRILISALSFLLGYELVEEEDDSEESSGEEDATGQKAQIVLSLTRKPHNTQLETVSFVISGCEPKAKPKIIFRKPHFNNNQDQFPSENDTQCSKKQSPLISRMLNLNSKPKSVKLLR